MRMARAPQEQIDALWKFLEGLAERTENGRGAESIGTFVRKNWRNVEACWERVVYGYQTLLQCTDPNLDYLEYRPDIKAALVAAGIEKDGE